MDHIAWPIFALCSTGAPNTPDPEQVDRVAVWDEVDRLPERQRKVIYLRLPRRSDAGVARARAAIASLTAF